MKPQKSIHRANENIMPRYLDPKNDFIFKRIFGENPDLLISFLNALMPFEPDRQIVEVEYLTPELVPENPGKKYSIVDVRCKDNFGRLFIIEMQMYWTDAFYNRVVFNAGKAYVRQLGKREKYELLQPVYALAILYENFDTKSDQFYHHFQIANRENTDEIIPGLEFVLIELQKFNPENVSDRKLATLWLRFLQEVDEKLRKLPIELQENELIRKASEICEEAAFTDDELYIYDKYWDDVRVEKTLISAARKEGVLDGKAKGIAEGKAIGIVEGKAIGRNETFEQIVIEAHRNNFTFEQIQLLTHLSFKQISEILRNK